MWLDEGEREANTGGPTFRVFCIGMPHHPEVTACKKGGPQGRLKPINLQQHIFSLMSLCPVEASGRCLSDNKNFSLPVKRKYRVGI